MAVLHKQSVGPSRTRFRQPSATGRRRLFWARLRARLRLWRNVWREREALASLDAAALKDIGLDPVAASREAQRPFWDAPGERDG